MKVPLDSRQLRAFATLAQTGSFTQTARQLHLSQSAISHAMKALEADLGCPLFDKLGKKLLLTHAGEALLRRSEKILREMGEAREELDRLRQWGRGRLRIGASSTACAYVLPGVLREFQQSFPQCDVMIEPTDATEALDLLRRRRADMVLTLKPKRVEPFQYRHLFTDELQFIVSPRHPWAALGRAPREELSKQPFILYNRQSYTSQLIERFLAEEGVVPQCCIEFGSMEAIKQMVKLGLGVSILAPWIAPEELAAGSLVALPLGRRKLKRHWGIVHWQGQRLSLAEETFIGLCGSFTKERAARPPGASTTH